ncbi:MAG: NAD(P)/FAD-dependent oxidoreductase [Bacillota bacterium]|nr:NAD(P)/FAD-dependent oxidoreductase [Bacillota bacterium]
MKRDWEVIVVGAGPSGSITASLLARLGHEVLLVDKDDFPRDKICGDALPSGVFNILADAGMKEIVDQAIAEGHFYPLMSMRLVAPSGQHLIAPLKQGSSSYYPHITSRLFFDDLLVRHAIRLGVEFRSLKVTGPLIENGQVIGITAEGDNSEILYAKVTVGADGVSSVISRHLRDRKRHVSKHRAMAIRGYIEGIEVNHNEAEFILYHDILPGYAWIFPTGENRANLGLGMRLDYYRRNHSNLKKMLEDFMTLPAIRRRLKQGAEIGSIAAWPLNFGSQKYLQYAFNGALLVGDAAGFISPLTGGGIHRSMISGQLAAMVIHEALQQKNNGVKLIRYEELCESVLLKELRSSYYLQELLLRFPFLVDIAVRFFKGILSRNMVKYK